MNTDNIDFTIDELVLEGVSPQEKGTVVRNIKKELSKLFTQKGIPGSFTRKGQMGNLEATLPEGNFEGNGKQIAQSLYNSLGTRT